jgi:hypothetical protein
MRRLTLLAALVLTALLITAVPVAAVPPATLGANLTGEQEVPGPGDPDGSGQAVVTVYQGEEFGESRMCYRLKAEGIEPATAAHIHRGVPSAAGPIVVTLKAPTDGSSSRCVAIGQVLSRELREQPGRYYVNVHNNSFPEGAIRGQLHR